MSKPSNYRSAITLLLKRIKDAGWVIDEVFNGKNWIECENSVQIAVAAVEGVDWATVWFYKIGSEASITFERNPKPEKMVHTYTMALAHVIEPILDAWVD